MAKLPTKPTEGAKKEALDHPGGYVYVIDEGFDKNEAVPPEAILGAWKVNDQGIIIGEFIPNPNYKDLSELI